ncbi:MAG TPA: acyl-CoA carboxylase subunit epsilon [Natronosporangium sp.]
MADPEPALRVVRGTPTDEELAALVGVLRTRSRVSQQAATGPSPWVRSGRPTAGRMPVHRGPSSWRHWR